MEYRLNYGLLMRQKFLDTPNLFTSYITRKKQIEDMTRLQNECISWLANNLHINYTYEIHTSVHTANSDPIPIEFIVFRYEEDMLVFRLRFGF